MAAPRGPAKPMFRGIGSLPRKGSPPRPSGSKGPAKGGSGILNAGVIEEIEFITMDLYYLRIWHRVYVCRNNRQKKYFSFFIYFFT